MVEIREYEYEDVAKELLEMLSRIRERIQENFEKLKIGHYDPDANELILPSVFDNEYYYLFEVSIRRKLFKIFSLKRKRRVFAINPSFFREALGERVVNCTIFRPGIEDVVKQELESYIKKFGVTKVNLKKDFVSSR